MIATEVQSQNQEAGIAPSICGGVASGRYRPNSASHAVASFLRSRSAAASLICSIARLAAEAFLHTFGAKSSVRLRER